jgi:hypothetical protein
MRCGWLLQCLGSVQHLKAKFGSGFSASLKLGMPTPAEIEETRAALAGHIDIPLGKLRAEAVASACLSMGRPDRVKELHRSGTGEQSR